MVFLFWEAGSSVVNIPIIADVNPDYKQYPWQRRANRGVLVSSGPYIPFQHPRDKEMRKHFPPIKKTLLQTITVLNFIRISLYVL